MSFVFCSERHLFEPATPPAKSNTNSCTTYAPWPKHRVPLVPDDSRLRAGCCGAIPQPARAAIRQSKLLTKGEQIRWDSGDVKVFSRKRNRGHSQLRFKSCRHAAATYNKNETNHYIHTLSLTSRVICFCGGQFHAGADNSARNQRDRSGETQTSGDQSNSSPDINTTAAIRRAIMHDDSLSMMAKNVKIVAENGAVTLRGPVKSAAEKAKIAELAQNAAQGAKIDNQLEVKAAE